MSETTNQFPLAGGALKHPILLSWLCIVGCTICSPTAFADGTGQPPHSLPGARNPLKPSAFIELPLKAVTPEGWLKLELEKTTRFPLVLHIPQWADGTKVRVNGASQETPRTGSFYTLARKWSNGDEVRIEMPMNVRLEGEHEGLVSVYRGPLLYGLHIGEERVKIRGEAPHCDYEIRR